jgi:hypothetical protein
MWLQFEERLNSSFRRYFPLDDVLLCMYTLKHIKVGFGKTAQPAFLVREGEKDFSA